MKAALNKEKRKHRKRILAHDSLRLRSSELLLWAISRFDVNDIEELTKEVADVGCQGCTPFQAAA